MGRGPPIRDIWNKVPPSVVDLWRWIMQHPPGSLVTILVLGKDGLGVTAEHFKVLDRQTHHYVQWEEMKAKPDLSGRRVAPNDPCGSISRAPEPTALVLGSGFSGQTGLSTLFRPCVERLDGLGDVSVVLILLSIYDMIFIFNAE